MNKQRRKGLQDIKTVYAGLCNELATLGQRFEALKDDLQGVLDDEQESFDALPESLQNGEKGDKAQDIILALENAVALLEAITEFTDSHDESEFHGEIDTAVE